MTLSLEPGPTGEKLNDSTEKAGRLLGADAFVSMPVFNALQLISEIKMLLPLVPALEVDRLKAEDNDERSVDVNVQRHKPSAQK